MSVVVELACPQPATLGESPLWHPLEQCLYYVDIAARQVLRLRDGEAQVWQLDSEPGCIAALAGGGLLVAQRNGLWWLDTASGAHERLMPPPFDPGQQRFNDGKPDAQGRFWVGTIDDARRPEAGLYRVADGQCQRMVDGITTANGLAWSPDQRCMYGADTKAHAIYAWDFDAGSGAISQRRVFAQFEPRQADQALDDYAGRPDGAAVDAEGCYWVAMFEGQRLLRLSPSGALLQTVRLPVRCPTMPAFGGPDLRTLYITTAREKRPAEELAAQPWAGCVLKLRVDVPGLPAQFARL
ncbi:SMP-30/gluconolactonase/LRE family protein [Paucibacter sediminis]|uniref:SMP-30/gluconolactonase/LRE family protein n=1 Tax=Paucibacter sediminis TaxID=3019553 RepID=A0AA95NHR7_9BURK|nr:SMP-30/gluconolactonase/LRE family protein [Paucibacter sp. S2-9]WIT13813.1 SMP-30/gluconolactonase/LRE family protein [Paucibacter sp. S2-9]